MPASDYGPWGTYEQGGVIDNSGGGQDPGYADSLAPGGRFPGDDQNWLSYQRGLDSGGAEGNPDYQTGWLLNLLSHGRAGQLIDAHASNVRSPGAGQAPHDAGAAGSNHFFSGPGGAYGPATGPTRGLVDQGRPPGEAWDGPELRPPGGGDEKPGKGKGRGGSQAGHFTFSPYQGIQQHGQFVDWQPTAFGEQPREPARFVGGSGSSTPGGPAAASPSSGRGKPGNSPGAGRGGPGGGSGAGGGRGQGAEQGSGSGGSGARPGAGNGGRGSGAGQGAQDPAGPFRLQNNHAPFNTSTYGGVDTNYLDYRTPGWMRDPTTGIMYTSGFPNATPRAPLSGFDPNVVGRSPVQGFDSYVTALHDAGYTNDDIMSLVGPYGYRQDEHGDWQWNWGTGPVVSTGPQGGGYVFARDASGFSGDEGGAAAGPGSSGFSSPGPFWGGGTYQHEQPAGTGQRGNPLPSLTGNLARTGNATNFGAGSGQGSGSGAVDRTMQGTNDLVGGAAFFHGSDI